jgi:deazaflavin-dependent oxidoreductase (nitroreductase family)
MTVQDSPKDWVKSHIDKYVKTGGEEGHEWQPGVYTLLLTTTGRKSGEQRRTALIYQPDGDNYAVVASNGGSQGHPTWYLNLLADPNARVQVGADEFVARARTASAEERPRLWALMNEVWPAYNEYQTKTDREIPVVILERV